MTLTTIINWLFLAVALMGAAVMARWDLQMLQQNSYFNSRYRRWLTTSEEHLTVKRVLLLALTLMTLVPFVAGSHYVTMLLIAVVAGLSWVMLRKKHKKPLVFTPRVWRHYLTEMVLVMAAAALVAVCDSVYMAAAVALLTATFSPLLTIAVNVMLHPVERHIANGFVRDAKRRLGQMNGLTVIGITGSFGKTSTKHYLHRILSEHFSVLMTPGSFNTPMGVVRTIREHMQPYNEVFICEMGAKNVGDIREICDIVHPRHGIITAVGPMHLETFGSIDNVQRTKFELADALPADGLLLVNNDFEYCANRAVDNVTTRRYTVRPTARADYWAEDVAYSARGTSFKMRGRDITLDLTTRLVGECNISNLIAAVAMALHLGVPHDKIRYAVSRIEQVEHRLELKRNPAGFYIIDDAYNSNPTGSRMALEVLGQMTDGKRYVITPGMIELGDRQVECNRELGEHIARNADVAVVVGEYNREAIVTGLDNRDFDHSRLQTVDSFAAGWQWLMNVVKPGDTILIENDLPDTFKRNH